MVSSTGLFVCLSAVFLFTENLILLFCCPAGKLWSRSLKLAYTLLNKLGTKNEPVLKPGDRVREGQEDPDTYNYSAHDVCNEKLMCVH